MNIEQLKKFIQLAKDENVTLLSYEDKECKMKVELGGGTPTMYAPTLMSTPQVSAQSNASSDPQAAESGDFKIIKSPFVGTFYSSPAPDKPSYVKVGDRVSKGQVLCILEAMKIMNEIDSDVDGEIVEICVSNESLVEYGQPLFKVK